MRNSESKKLQVSKDRDCRALHRMNVPGVVSRDVCVYAGGPRRAFSRTRANSGRALPVFLEPSTPELTSLLSTLNSKVLLPSHLSKEQEKLVYRHANKSKLEADPIEITLGDVTLPLEHLDRNHLPNRWDTFSEVVKKSETREDGENVIRMLEGFHNAGIKVKSGWQNMIIRHLNSNDMHHLVLKALQRVKATGLSLRDFEVLVCVLRGIHDKAVLMDWDEEETVKALRMAKQVVEMLEDSAHHGAPGRGELISKDDHRTEPVVIALPTALAAELAQRHDGDVEEVKRLASRLLSALKQSKFSERLKEISTKTAKSESDFKSGTQQMSAVVDLKQDLFQLTVIWHALSASRKALGAAMPTIAGTEKLEASTLKALQDGLKAIEKLRVRGGKKMEHEDLDEVKATFAKCGYA